EGSSAWILDENTPANGGGLYRVAIDCDGTLTDLGLQLVIDFPTAAAWLNTKDRQAVIFATAIGDGGTRDAGQNVFVVDLSTDTPVVKATAAAFPDQDAVPASVAVRLDDKWVAVPDDGFSVGNRLDVLGYDGTAFSPGPVLMPM